MARDDEANPSKGVLAARELIQRVGVVALVGGLDTPVSMAVVPIANQMKVPFLGPWAAGTGITRNGAALGNVVSAEITYANNLDRIETIRSDGRIDGADPSIAALTGRVEVRFADQTLVNQAIAGDPCELEFAYALPSGESFTFTAHAVHLPRPRIEIAGPQGVQATFGATGTPCSSSVASWVASWATRTGSTIRACRTTGCYSA